jgi:hypothetical protein
MNWNGTAKWLAVVGVSSVLMRGAPSAQGAEAPKDPKAMMEEIDHKIDDLQKQRDALEMQAQLQEEQLEELAGLQDQARERQQELANELGDLGTAEFTDSAAVKAQRECRTKWLHAADKILVEALAVKDIAGLDKLRSLLYQIENMDSEWDLLQGPRLDAAITMEEMESLLAETPDATEPRRELLARIRTLYKEAETLRDARFKAAKAAITQEREIQRLVERFRAGN